MKHWYEILTIVCNNPGCGNIFKDKDIAKGECQRCTQVIFVVNMDLESTQRLIAIVNRAQMNGTEF